MYIPEIINADLGALSYVHYIILELPRQLYSSSFPLFPGGLTRFLTGTYLCSKTPYRVETRTMGNRESLEGSSLLSRLT